MSEHSLLDPRICGYYRSACYLISTNKELISKESVTESFNASTSSPNYSLLLVTMNIPVMTVVIQVVLMTRTYLIIF